jgi:hypothetical protein
MGFSDDHLAEYLLQPKLRSPPKVAMNWLKQLLFKELGEYCKACEADRMLCVLAPACTERILLKVRMQSHATIDDLPKFCYAQSLNNFKRYLEKKTTLYEPVDVWLYNEDFIEVLFPKIKAKTFEKNLQDIKEIYKIIKKSNVPAVLLDINNVDYKIFKKIIEKDKMIREGTFLYEIWDHFMIVWYERKISITDFSKNITICNGANDYIENLKILEMVFRTICAEFNIENKTEYKSDKEIFLQMKMPIKELTEKIEKDSAILEEMIVFLQNYFFEISYSFEQEKFIVSLSCQNDESLLDRIGLTFINFNAIRKIIQYFYSLNKNAII